MKKIIIFILFLNISFAFVYPESVFNVNGLGERYYNNSSYFVGIGKTGLGFGYKNLYNVQNPASLSMLDKTFVSFNVGSELHWYKGNDFSYKESSANIPEFSLGINLYKNFTVGLSYQVLHDFTYSALTIEDEYNIESDQTGSLSKYSLSFGGGFENFSVGVDLSFSGGKRKWNYILDWNDSGLLSTEYSISHRYEGFSLKIGTLFNFENFGIGFVFTPKHTLDDVVILENEFTEITKKDSSLVYPKSYGAGINYSFYKDWSVLLDFQTVTWEDSNIKIGETGTLHDEKFFGIGINKTRENKKYFKKYLEKLEYGIGYYYKQWSYENVNISKLHEQGITARITFPLAKDQLFIDFSAVGLLRGKIEDNLAEEKLLQFKIGIRGLDIWPLRRNVYEE